MDPIRIELVIKADDSLLELARVLLKSQVAPAISVSPKEETPAVVETPAVQPRQRKTKAIVEEVKAEGEIKGVTVPVEQPKTTETPKAVEKPAAKDPFEKTEKGNMSLNEFLAEESEEEKPIEKPKAAEIDATAVRVAVNSARTKGVAIDSIRAILREMGCEKVGDLKQEQMASFIKKVNALEV